ncbi:hypothetical protein [Caldinitratiruptor microaerophilus]|uniref:Uncharacterized protein n=1 Tax=Caldinitratiruptor microaerophilus TaxID=671077 RepID=A0AA35CIF5_9FIRM|nr:hypothetical protein [Caldinitratiruptor microaerophilus]BDG59627.1 hypothetical protein caldi_07170 [Caldinitratiruptor microaerophilus]
MSPRRLNARPDEVPLYTRAQRLEGAAMFIDLACEELERGGEHILMNSAYGLRNEVLAWRFRLLDEAKARGEVRQCDACGGSGKAPNGWACKACAGVGLVSRDGLRLPGE